MALFTGIGTALGFSAVAAAGSTMSAATAVGLGVSALAAGGTMAYMASQGGNKQIGQTQMPAAPKAPKMEDQAKLAQQKAMDKKRSAARSESVKTNPLGIKDEATVAKKKLLGG